MFFSYLLPRKQILKSQLKNVDIWLEKRFTIPTITLYYRTSQGRRVSRKTCVYLINKINYYTRECAYPIDSDPSRLTATMYFDSPDDFEHTTRENWIISTFWRNFFDSQLFSLQFCVYTVIISCALRID